MKKPFLVAFGRARNILVRSGNFAASAKLAIVLLRLPPTYQPFQVKVMPHCTSGRDHNIRLPHAATMLSAAMLVSFAVSPRNAFATDEFRQQILAQTPIAYWHLSDDPTGETASDLVGDHTAVRHDVTGTRFTGSGYLDLGKIDIDAPELTIVARFTSRDFQTSDARIISKATGTNIKDHVWMLSTVAAGDKIRLRVRLRAGGKTKELTATSGDLAKQEEITAALVYNGKTVEIFANGKSVGKTNHHGRVNVDSHTDAWIGDNPSGRGSRPFRGDIYDVAIFDHALSAKALTALDAALKSKPQPTPALTIAKRPKEKPSKQPAAKVADKRSVKPTGKKTRQPAKQKPAVVSATRSAVVSKEAVEATVPKKRDGVPEPLPQNKLPAPPVARKKSSEPESIPATDVAEVAPIAEPPREAAAVEIQAPANSAAIIEGTIVPGTIVEGHILDGSIIEGPIIEGSIVENATIGYPAPSVGILIQDGPPVDSTYGYRHRVGNTVPRHPINRYTSEGVGYGAPAFPGPMIQTSPAYIVPHCW